MNSTGNTFSGNKLLPELATNRNNAPVLHLTPKRGLQQLFVVEVYYNSLRLIALAYNNTA